MYWTIICIVSAGMLILYIDYAFRSFKGKSYRRNILNILLIAAGVAFSAIMVIACTKWVIDLSKPQGIISDIGIIDDFGRGMIAMLLIIINAIILGLITRWIKVTMMKK
jgi:hypothetical protein